MGDSEENVRIYERGSRITTGEQIAARPCPRCPHLQGEHDIVPDCGGGLKSVCLKEGCNCRWLSMKNGVVSFIDGEVSA